MMYRRGVDVQSHRSLQTESLTGRDDWWARSASGRCQSSFEAISACLLFFHEFLKPLLLRTLIAWEG